MDAELDLLEGDVELTEFTHIDVKSIKGVKQGANGFPVLLMKGLPAAAKADAEAGPAHGAFTGTHSHTHAANGAQGDDGTHSHEHTHDGDGDHGHTHAAKSAAGITAAALAKAVTDGQVDEKPDVALGQQIMTLLGQAIANEAAEISAGAYGETQDVKMLARAADIVSTWCAREQAVADGQDPDAPCGCCPYCSGMGCGCCPSCGSGVLMCSAADEAAKSSAEINDLPDSKFGYIEPGGKKDSDGKTTPRKLRHFPLHDEKHVRLAVQMLSTSPHGDKAKSKVMAAAKEHGIETSDSDAGKSAVAEGETGVQTDTQETGSLSKAVEDALAKAIGPLKERLEAFGADLAKVMAAPVPGGPVLSAARPQAASGGDDWAAKAAYYRQKAELVTDPVDRDGYRQLAREASEKAQAATA